jgi:hypothetical protein
MCTKSLTNRRHFVGGSDARIIMGDNEEARSFGSGAKNEASSSRRTYPGISWSSLAQ